MYFAASSKYFQDLRNASDTRYQFLAGLPFTDPLGLQVRGGAGRGGAVVGGRAGRAGQSGAGVGG